MKKEMVVVYERIRNVHAEAYSLLSQIREQLKQEPDIDEHADAYYACHETSKYLDDLRKELNKLSEQSQKIACAMWVREGTGDKIRTDFCTVSPEVKMVAIVPRKKDNPEAYSAFMRSIGVSQEIIDQEEDVVRPHWPGLVDYISQLVSAGKPLPPGIDPEKMYPNYHLHVRAKMKGVDE